MGTKFDFSSHSLEVTKVTFRVRLRLLRPAYFFPFRVFQPRILRFSFLQHKLLCCPLDIPEIIFVDEVSFSIFRFLSFRFETFLTSLSGFPSILCSMVTESKFSDSCLMTQS